MPLLCYTVLQAYKMLQHCPQMLGKLPLLTLGCLETDCVPSGGGKKAMQLQTQACFDYAAKCHP